MAAATSAQWHSNPLNPTSAAPPPQYVVPSSAGVNEQPLPQATSTSPSPFQPPTAMRSHAGGVTVDLQLERTLFVARGVLAGRVLVNVDRAKGVKVGRISVEVFGYEETTPSKSAHRRLLLHHIMPLQEALNASAMPTDVVVPGPPDEHSMWPARKGKHALPFAIPLENARNGTDGVRVEVEGPRPLPSSFWSRGVGGVRYIVTCTIDIKTGNSRPLAPLTTYTPFLLLESLPLKLSGGPQHFESTLEAGSLLASEMTTVVNGRYLFGLGKKGEIKLRASAKIPTSVPAAETGYQPAENVWLAGSTGLVGVEIENGCQRRITALKIRLIRRLKTFSQHANTPVNPPNNLNTTTTTLFAEAASSTLLPLSFSREVIAKRCWRYKKTEQLFEEDANKTQEVLAWKGVGRGETRAMVVDLAIPVSRSYMHNSDKGLSSLTNMFSDRS
ncbi:uncharacterized protein EV422DRAFT_383848 [Fimicolochytrium jonesii]|uniref:uncharacterized protein n=1 Tax=Fimicolochytrium jonesii TaxID=1396493 RepID=UPI0022FEEECE|nr:uncharacterized protein EV422DRAFT_383848 [Fimicolochytrium jonesii]KAI8822906.1 hypothetical protein EV422DRAFT_383848 [Fimicolochytrium jonesii]